MVNKIKAKRLELDVSDVNESIAYENLIELLKKNELFSTRFLYRGTGHIEIKMLKGRKLNPNSPRLVESYEEDRYHANNGSIECYTLDDLEAIENGTENPDLGSPVYWAQTSSNNDAIVAVYKKEKLVYVGKRSNFEYRFKDFQNRADALAAVVRLV